MTRFLPVMLAALLALASCGSSARLEFVKTEGDKLTVHYSRQPSGSQRIPHFYLMCVLSDSFGDTHLDTRFFEGELVYPRSTATLASKIDGVGHPPAGSGQNGYEYDLTLDMGMQVEGRRYFMVAAWMNSNGNEVLDEVVEVTQLLESWRQHPGEEHTQWL